MSRFTKLGLSPKLVHALEQNNIVEPTEIQEQAIPFLLSGDRDFLGLAQTGTGKTAAFSLPLLELLDPHASHVQALILAPTRELARQIEGQIRLFSEGMPYIKTLSVYGGTPISRQIKSLKSGVSIVVATPGRLIDHINRGTIKLSSVDYMVLDEADEMLNMGFKPDLDTILKATPSSIKKWLFSATMAKDIRSIVKNYMDKPIEVSISPKVQVNRNIVHQFLHCTRASKPDVLSRILDSHQDKIILIFTRTKLDAQELADFLADKSYKTGALHGDLNQKQRDRVMGKFRKKEIRFLIATDVAARGIDVDDIDYVIHYALPDDNAFYTHRSGRTARAGKSGISLALVDGRDQRKIKYIESKLKIKFTKINPPSKEDFLKARMIRWAESIRDTPYNPSQSGKLFEMIYHELGHLDARSLLQAIVQSKVNEVADIDDVVEEKQKKSSYKNKRNKRRSPGSKRKSKWSSSKKPFKGRRGKRN